MKDHDRSLLEKDARTKCRPPENTPKYAVWDFFFFVKAQTFLCFPQDYQLNIHYNI